MRNRSVSMGALPLRVTRYALPCPPTPYALRTSTTRSSPPTLDFPREYRPPFPPHRALPLPPPQGPRPLRRRERQARAFPRHAQGRVEEQGQPALRVEGP